MGGKEKNIYIIIYILLCPQKCPRMWAKECPQRCWEMFLFWEKLAQNSKYQRVEWYDRPPSPGYGGQVPQP